MIKPPMTNSTSSAATRPFKTALLFAALAATTAFAQAPQPRITRAIDNTSRATIPGTLSPRALPASDVGALPASTKLQGITLVFSRTPAQQAALDALVAAQQNPSSPQYHQWLTPAQFGAQFGVADSDIAATEAWLQQQGFTINGVSNSRDRIHFSGTEGQVESAFATQLHNFKSGSQTHFAPATALSVPSALASSVLTVENLSSFRPKPHVRLAPAQPKLTTSQSGDHILTPLDIATIYDVKAAYNAGYTGANQSIAIIGESLIAPADITSFQTAIGLPAKPPITMLVPNTGTADFSEGDEAESDLDLEYSGSIAKGATIYFVYSGSDTNAGVFPNSLEYAVDENVAPIISSSYGQCELFLASGEYASLNGTLEQAAVQGQTVLNAAGDDGSTDCFGDQGTQGITLAQVEQIAVDYPASSQYVTALGGTEFLTSAVAAGNNTYFAAPTSTDIVSSALSYIPEQVWNDDAAAAPGGVDFLLDSGGGGVSTLTPRPTWQANVPGIPAGTFRLVPDISLDASNYNAPYAFCSSDPTAYNTGQLASCTSGLRDAYSQSFTLAGGTSFATPIFAGMLAIINQSQNSTGQGLINPTLYTLASNPTTYASAFHDTTVAGNQCLAGTAYCSSTGASEYAATTGYDEASGLGSVDLYKLLTAWPQAAAALLLPTSTTLTPATTIPTAGTSDAITITVSPIAATGTVTLTVDSVALAPLTLIAGTATYSFTSVTPGTHTIVAAYSGNVGYAPSTATLIFVVGGTSTGSATLTGTNVTVGQAGSASSTLTLTPANGYVGNFTFDTIDISNINSPATSLIYACASSPANIAITSAAVGTSSIVFTTGVTSTSCPAGAIPLVRGATVKFANGKTLKVIVHNDPASVPHKPSPLGPASSGIAAAGLLIAGIFTRRSRKLRSCLAICFLAVLGLALSGCSNKAASTATTIGPEAPQGVYAVILTGNDVNNPAIAAEATFTLTIN